MNVRRQFLLGVFFLATLSVLVFYSLFFTDFTLFKDVTEETVYFPEVSGLREGDPVMVSGLRIGRVGPLEFDLTAPREQRIKALLLLERPLEFRSGYSVQIKETTMLGGRNIEIEPGAFDAPFLDRSASPVLIGSVAPNPLSALGSVGEIFNKNNESFTRIIKNIDEVIAKINTGDGPIGHIFNDAEMARDLTEGMRNLRTATESLAQAAADVNAGRGVLGSLLHDEELAANLKATVNDIRNLASELNAGRGTFGRFLKDDTLADEFERTVRSLSSFAQKLEEGEGVIARLASDPVLAEDVSQIVSNLRTASEDLSAVVTHVRSGQGTLGALVMNDELYQEVLRTVGLLTRSLEDYREAAPITSFTGVLFSAF